MKRFVEPTDRVTLVLGATGYVGGRLIPQLLERGHAVRCLTRRPESLRDVPWAAAVDVVEGDLLDPTTLTHVFEGVGTIVYLVHALDESGDFADLEARAASATAEAAAAAGADHIVYLSGLGHDDDLSPHLESRQHVGRVLAAGPTPVTELRAAVILGAGSASFEMLRSLTEVLPVMIAPTWLQRTMVQPIAISDVLDHLTAAIDRAPDASGASGAPNAAMHRIIQIGGPDVMTYRELIDAYCDAAGLPRRRIVTLPIIPLAASARWVGFVTPLPDRLAARLVESLQHDVVVTDDSASELSTTDPRPVREAIELAIAAIDDLDVPTRWSGITTADRAAQPRPWDPDWAGGTVLEDRRERTAEVPASRFMQTVRGIGGERGWYGFGALWSLRGLLDQLVGGVGLRRGRRHPDEITEGEALDFWRVEEVGENVFRLRAEMRLPGLAWLEWTAEPIGDRSARIVQRARYVPFGLWGRVYWWLLLPFHALLFPLMLRRLTRVAAA